jgi:hypothetical protein
MPLSDLWQQHSAGDDDSSLANRLRTENARASSLLSKQAKRLAGNTASRDEEENSNSNWSNGLCLFVWLVGLVCVLGLVTVLH